MIREKDEQKRPFGGNKYALAVVTGNGEFSFDLWTWFDADDGSIIYPAALCKLETKALECCNLRIGHSCTVISGNIAFYPDDGEWFTVLDNGLKFPVGMTDAEAATILAAIFEDAHRGAAVTDDWVARTIDIDAFLRGEFGPARSHQIAGLFREIPHDLKNF